MGGIQSNDQLRTSMNWVGFLNEASTWESQTQAERFFSHVSGDEVRLTQSEIAELSQLEYYIREQLAAMHFGRKLDLESMNKCLAKLRLHMSIRSSTQDDETISLLLPSLQASLGNDRSKVESILDTFLFQFAVFTGGVLDSSAPYSVSRCEAICRKRSVDDCKHHYQRFRSLEDTWRLEVASDLQNIDEVERCADFFISGTNGAKFCSDACRFNSFALRKLMTTPSYQAEKQKRYRERQKSKS